MMNISERASKYAESKANLVITKAIEEAFIEGYKTGYKDREEETPMDLRDKKTEYIDLGLPSGTLWATEFESLDGEPVYLPYQEAEKLSLPTKEQWEELFSQCEWFYEFGDGKRRSRFDILLTKCVGINGQVLYFKETSFVRSDKKEDRGTSFFWIKEENDSNEGPAVVIKDDGPVPIGGIVSGKEELVQLFKGYKLPVRQVK